MSTPTLSLYVSVYLALSISLCLSLAFLFFFLSFYFFQLTPLIVLFEGSAACHYRCYGGAVAKNAHRMCQPFSVNPHSLSMYLSLLLSLSLFVLLFFSSFSLYLFQLTPLRVLFEGSAVCHYRCYGGAVAEYAHRMCQPPLSLCICLSCFLYFSLSFSLSFFSYLLFLSISFS